MTFEVNLTYAKEIEEVMEMIHAKRLLKSGYFTETIRKVIEHVNPNFSCSIIYIFEPKSSEDVKKFEENTREELLSNINNHFQVLLENGNLRYICTMGELNVL